MDGPVVRSEDSKETLRDERATLITRCHLFTPPVGAHMRTVSGEKTKTWVGVSHPATLVNLILSAVTRWRYSTPRGGEFLHELTADSMKETRTVDISTTVCVCLPLVAKLRTICPIVLIAPAIVIEPFA
jgi:hypothetical protein